MIKSSKILLVVGIVAVMGLVAFFAFNKSSNYGTFLGGGKVASKETMKVEDYLKKVDEMKIKNQISEKGLIKNGKTCRNFNYLTVSGDPKTPKEVCDNSFSGSKWVSIVEMTRETYYSTNDGSCGSPSGYPPSMSLNNKAQVSLYDDNTIYNDGYSEYSFFPAMHYSGCFRIGNSGEEEPLRGDVFFEINRSVVCCNN